MAIVNEGNDCVNCEGSFKRCEFCTNKEDSYSVECDGCGYSIHDYVYTINDNDDYTYDLDCLYKELQKYCEQDISTMDLCEIEDMCDVTIQKYSVDEYLELYT